MTVKRSLFQQARNPGHPRMEQTPPPSDNSVSAHQLVIRFVGTLIEAGRAVAFVAPDGKQKLVRLSVGDHFREWRVVAVSADQLVLSNGGEERRYTLFETSK